MVDVKIASILAAPVRTKRPNADLVTARFTYSPRVRVIARSWRNFQNFVWEYLKIFIYLRIFIFTSIVILLVVWRFEAIFKPIRWAPPPPTSHHSSHRGPTLSPLIDSSQRAGAWAVCRHFRCREKKMEVSFAFLQTLDEFQFIYILSWTILLLSFIVAICLIFLEVEYGRYFKSNSWQNCLSAVDGRIAWFVQELPAFVIPCALLFYARKDALGLNPNTILLSLYVLHYCHR